METNSTPGNLSRQLAAIMFADIMGYTAMMQQDERQAMVLRDRMRKTLEHLIPGHGGKIIQFYGDGMLALFNSSAVGVTCAVEIQQELQKDPNVPLRIGLHSGDVCFDEHGVYGDCVNVASRIEALSSPGAVLISDKVYDEIKNQATIATSSLGLFSLKNVKRQIEVFAITNEGLTIPTIAQTSVKEGTERSIAVLPFLNLSADPENEYFSDGISEEILNVLSKVDGLQVCSRTSSFVYKGQQQDVREISQKLGVSAILEGSVRHGGNKVRISAQLVNAVDGYHIWSETFDGDLDDIFKVQDDIAASIATSLRVKFSVGEKSDVESEGIPGQSTLKAPTENLEAYNLYLKGLFYWNQSNPEAIKKAMQVLEEAIVLDPEFASAYCLLSNCYCFMGSAGLLMRAGAFSKAKDYTLKALEIDPEHAESHLSYATIKFLQNWDFKGAEISFEKARSLGLNSALFNQMYGMFLIAQGRFTDAVDRIEQALKQEPLSLSLICLLGDAYAFARQFDKALSEYDRVIEMDPNFRRAYDSKGLTYLAMGDYEMAIQNLEQYQKLVGHPLKGLAGLGYAYGLAGYTDKARDCLEKTRQRQEVEPDTNLNLEFALINTGLGELDKGLEYLRKMYEQRANLVCMGMIYCVRYPVLLELKSNTEFKSLVEKMGLS